MTEWILIILGLILLFFAYRLLKKAMSIAFTVLTVIGIILVILGFVAVQDARDFKNNFGNSKSIFVQSDNGTYLSAILIDFNSSDKGFSAFDEERIPELLESDLPEEYYKIFLVEREAFENTDLENVSLGIGELTKNETIEAMYSEEPIENAATSLAERHDAPQGEIEEQIIFYFPDEKFRRYLFSQSLMEIFGGNPLGLIGGLKDENIIIYPEPLMFKTINLIPFPAFRQAAGWLGDDEEEVRNGTTGQG